MMAQYIKGVDTDESTEIKERAQDAKKNAVTKVVHPKIKIYFDGDVVIFEATKYEWSLYYINGRIKEG